MSLYREFEVLKSEIKVCFFPIRQSLGMRYTLMMSDIFSRFLVFLISIRFIKTSILKPIKIFNLTDILDETINKTAIIVIII